MDAKQIIQFIDTNIICCMIPMILILMLVEFVFKGKFPTKKVLNLLAWIIVGYTALILIEFIANLMPQKIVLPLNRINSIHYWVTMSCSLLLPFLLMIKANRSRFLAVLMLAFLMKVTAFIEWFATTSLHRDKVGMVVLKAIPNYCMQGVLIVFALLGGFHFFKKTVAAN